MEDEGEECRTVSFLDRVSGRIGNIKCGLRLLLFLNAEEEMETKDFSSDMLGIRCLKATYELGGNKNLLG